MRRGCANPICQQKWLSSSFISNNVNLPADIFTLPADVFNLLTDTFNLPFAKFWGFGALLTPFSYAPGFTYTKIPNKYGRSTTYRARPFLMHSSTLRCQINVPPLINFWIFSNPPNLIRTPHLLILRKLNIFTNLSFHFLSLLVLFTPKFHGKIAYCCIYLSLSFTTICFCSFCPCIII